MKIGNLAFGSLIDDPGVEVGGVISGNPITGKSGHSRVSSLFDGLLLCFYQSVVDPAYF